jgi:DNA replication protein DnaC
MSFANERLRDLCQHLGLDALANDFPGLAERAAKDELTFTDFLETGLRLELQARQARSSTLITRIAGFPSIKTLDGYDFEFATGAPRQLLMELANLSFIERCENVVLLGPSELSFASRASVEGPNFLVNISRIVNARSTNLNLQKLTKGSFLFSD